MKTVLIFLVIALMIGFVANFFFASEKRDITKVQIGNLPAQAGNIWNVEVVSSLSDRIKGLSGRESLRKESGMLFIFPESDFHGIWMKDMNFSIDIIWISEELQVVGLYEGVVPESYPEVFRPEAEALYVLEINAGEADKAKIKIGDVVTFF